ncbi:MAG: hypothetical protein AAF840_19025, partial [Bacteroidota bacterium]
HKATSIEVYSQTQSITFTGDVIKNRPIAKGQLYINQLIDQLGGYPHERKEGAYTRPNTVDPSDLELQRRLLSNEKAKYWMTQGYFNDAKMSEEDLGFLNLIAFWTADYDQILRTFQNSAIYRGNGHPVYGWKQGYENNENLYVERYLRRSIDKAMYEAHMVWRPEIEKKNTSPVPPLAPTSKEARPISANPPMDLPPGRLGQFARYFEQTARYPMREAAIAGAIGLFNALFGGRYSYGSTCLTTYTMLLAPTGTGKEHAIRAPEAVIKQYIPTRQDHIVTAEVASGQALSKEVASRGDLLYCVTEFSKKMGQLYGNRPNPNTESFLNTWLAFYSASTTGKIGGGIHSKK